MDFQLTEEQVLLTETVATLCRHQHPLSALRTAESSPEKFSTNFWQDLVSLGLCGLCVPEAEGGAGLGTIEIALVYEEFGRQLVTSPHFASALTSAKILEQFKSSELSEIAAGRIISPAIYEASHSFGLQNLQVSLSRAGTVKLNGTKVLVPFATSADLFLVLTNTAFVLVDAKAEGVSNIFTPNLGGEALSQVAFDNVTLSDANILTETGALGIWDASLDDAFIAIAAEAIGGAQAVLEMTTAYAKEREQFGQPIGAFQAIAHYLADMVTEIEGTRTLVYQAAWAKAEGRPARKLAAMAKLQATDVFRKCAAKGIQIHGGLGFTKEGDPQLYFRRAKQRQLLYGDPGFLEDRIADCLFEDSPNERQSL